MTTMDPNATLFWFYLLSGVFNLSMAGLMWAAWFVRRDSDAGMAAMLLLWLSVDMFAKAVMRATQAIVTLEQALYVSRMATIGIVTTGAWMVDTYFASHNGHLSMLRRFVLWYRRSDDEVWEKWRREHDRD